MINAKEFFLVLPIHRPAECVEFYQRIGFQEKSPQLWADSHYLSDGRLQLLLTPAAQSRSGLAVLSRTPLDELAAILKEADLPITLHDDHLLLISPGGTACYIFHAEESLQPEMPYQPSRFGDFYELSIETPDLKKETIFWKSLGFAEIPDLPGGKTWLTLHNQSLRIGQYLAGSCPHPFHSPALTFFMPDSAERIQALSQEGLPPAHTLPAEEGERVKEAIWEDPAAHHLFLFQAWW
jgi:hypothetical protein